MSTTLQIKALNKPATKPMPKNVRIAKWSQYVHHTLEYSHGRGVFRTASSPELRLMTWGRNHTIQTVLDNPGRRYVWMNCNADGDRFEEEL